MADLVFVQEFGPPGEISILVLFAKVAAIFDLLAVGAKVSHFFGSFCLYKAITLCPNSNLVKRFAKYPYFN